MTDSASSAAPVLLTSGLDEAWLTELSGRAEQARGDLSASLTLAREVAERHPTPGVGGTAELWSALATLGAVDLGVARIAEPHLDAIGILTQAGMDIAPDATYGVFAAEGPGMRLEASETGDGWRLSGQKPWCSLAGELSHALVTAWTGPDSRRLFSIPLAQVQVLDRPWPSRGLAEVPSGPIEMQRVTGDPVGDDGWYLRRPGFWWGGCGVAAVWFGGAVGLARSLRAAAGKREPDQVAQMLLGQVDVALHSARLALADAARRADGDDETPGEVVMGRTRLAVHDACELVLRSVGHGLGPAPLTQDEQHAKRVADLEVYLRQCHAERDEAALGRSLLANPQVAW